MKFKIKYDKWFALLFAAMFGLQILKYGYIDLMYNILGMVIFLIDAIIIHRSKESTILSLEINTEDDKPTVEDK